MTAYKLPTSTRGFPNGLSLNQFIQTVLVGISGLPGNLVRPKWQVSPPKQPDLTVNWLAFGVSVAAPDANGYVGVTQTDATIYSRNETLDVSVSIYGPDALETYGLLRDGFQLQSNLDGLRSANMGFVEILPARRLPDLINERFINRQETSIFLRRQIQRVYPVLTLLSANGTIYSVLGNEDYALPWEAGEEA